jgi:hypothetical protein
MEISWVKWVDVGDDEVIFLQYFHISANISPIFMIPSVQNVSRDALRQSK